MIQGTDGRLYGTTTGGIFAIATDGTGFTVLNALGGTASPSKVIQGNDGRLYGTTAYGGTGSSGIIYAINTDGTGFTVLSSFAGGSGGGNPFGGVIQGSDGRLYGTAAQGGFYGPFQTGTVFAVNTDGTGLTVLHSFEPPGDGGTPMAG